MKILLVSAPLEFPLAVYGLAAQLRSTPDTADCVVEILNLDSSRLNEYDRKNAEIWRYIGRLEAFRPDLVAFSVYLWSHLSIRELIGITHQLYPGTAMVVGGPELATTEAAAQFLAAGEVTAAVRGEGEITFLELVRRLRSGGGPASVPGCSWIRDGTVVHEPPRPRLRDLSVLASPFLAGQVPEDLFDRLAPDRPGTFRRAFMETYRGCYMECAYCQWGDGSKERFQFPQGRVKAELTWLLSRRVSRLFIVDAMFGYKKQAAKDLLRHIIEEKRRHGAHTAVVCYHNQDYFDPELFDLYREANVWVELDLQSTDPGVLAGIGRAKWSIDSFDRHLAAFREHEVPTTRASDVIVGLPGDRLSSFLESADLLLRRGMAVTLYEASVIPNTRMARSAVEDGTVFSAVPPRLVLRNRTFPVHEMVAARLVGYGLKFFRHYPRTAQLLWRHGFSRPVDLCRRIGDLVEQRHAQRDTALPPSADELLVTLLEDLRAEDWLRLLSHDLFRLESAAARLTLSPRQPMPTAPVPAPPSISDRSWTSMRLRYRREDIEEARIEHRLESVLTRWDAMGELPSEEFWKCLPARCEPMVALVYLDGAHTRIWTVDECLTYQLLVRCSGHFSVSECLANLANAGRDVRPPELAAVRETLSGLIRLGVLECPAD